MKFNNYKHPVHSNYEIELEDFRQKFTPFIKKGDWVIDIGASSGDSTLVMGYLAGQSGKVLAFEPSAVVNLLKRNVDNNIHLSNFEIHNFGILDSDCEKNFYVTDSLDNGGIVGEDLFKNEKRFTNCRCRFVNGDSFLKSQYKENLSKIRFVKIDTEGTDYLILENLLSFSKEYKPVYFVEWWHTRPVSDLLFNVIEKMDYNAIRDDDRHKARKEDFSTKSANIILIPKI